MTKQQRQTLLAGILFVAFGIFMLICTTGVEVKHLGGDMGSAMFPYIVSFLVLVCGIIITISTSYQIKQQKGAETAQTEAKEKKPDNTKSVILGFVCFVLYAVLLKPLGFIVSSILFLVAMMNVMAPEKPTKKDEIVMVILSICLPVIVYFIFVQLLNVILPAGILRL